MSRSLPPHPDLEQYKKQAKDLLKAARAGAADAVRRIEAVRNRCGQYILADAQLALAREHGYASWPRFVKEIESLSGQMPRTIWRAAADAVIAGGARMRARKPRVSRMPSKIITGDVVTLERLLKEDPSLVEVRSERDHHSQLLHYVGANGIQGFRQKTPKNAVAVLELLLAAGADINAVGDMYRGTTTLGLVATSIHPELAGVQDALIAKLLEHGATFDGAVASDYTAGSVVSACLANGRPHAARLLAELGAPLNLEGAAGVGRRAAQERRSNRTPVGCRWWERRNSQSVAGARRAGRRAGRGIRDDPAGVVRLRLEWRA